MSERINNKKLLIVLFFLILLVAAGVFFSLKLAGPGEMPPKAITAATPAPPASGTPAPKAIEYRETIRSGFSLAEILAKHNFTPGQIHKLKEQVKPVYDLGKIKAGRELRFFLTDAAEITGFEYPIEENKFLTVRREGENYSASIREIPYIIETAIICGLTQGNLTAAVTDLKETEILAYEFAELFGWDVDFNSDQRPDDSFRVVFEKRFLEGKFTGYGSILTAEFTNQGKTFRAFLFTYPDTKAAGYYDEEGKSMKKEFLKSPFSFSPRITSRFSMRRLHPIERIIRPHFGVDYGAPVGTPVQATADGTVTFAGWNGASGRMITVRHRNGYETLYLHLSGFASGIRNGARVSSGQAIGYVGSTGESNGPHLDYRIRLNGSYINPLNYKFNPVEPLRKEFLEDYRKVVSRYRMALNAPFEILNYLPFFH